MGVVYPCPDPDHLNSHRHGQDHGVKFFPMRFQSLVVMSLNPDFVTWFKAVEVRGRSRLINLGDGSQSCFWTLWRASKDLKNLFWSYSAKISDWRLGSRGGVSHIGSKKKEGDLKYRGCS